MVTDEGGMVAVVVRLLWGLWGFGGWAWDRVCDSMI